MKYVMAEVFSGKLMELEEDKYTERREKVYTFMKIPREFEKVLGRCLLLSARPWAERGSRFTRGLLCFFFLSVTRPKLPLSQILSHATCDVFPPEAVKT